MISKNFAFIFIVFCLNLLGLCNGSINVVEVDYEVDTKSVAGRTTEKMVSFNLDWHEDHEEAPLWIGMSAMKLDLDNPKLINSARALSPGILRIGGSEGDVVCYDVPDFNSTCKDMNQTDSFMCLNMSRWEKLSKFASDTGNKLVFGLNFEWGRPGHSFNHSLDFTNIEAFLAYTSSKQIEVHGFELGNEKCAGSPKLFAGDYIHFKTLVEKYWPNKSNRPLIIGNDCNTNPGFLAEFLPILNNSVLDVLTYHRYVGYGLDPSLASEIMTPKFLNQAVSAEILSVHEKFASTAELWVGEGAAAWHSGRDLVTNSFVSSFWYADALGNLSKHGHSAYCRQTFIGGSYGLLNRTSYEPNPDFYVGLFFKKHVGNTFFPTKLSNNGNGYLREYAFCSRDKLSVNSMFINISPNTTFNVKHGATNVEEYHLCKNDKENVGLNSRSIKVNGQVLRGVSPSSIQHGVINKGGVTTVSAETIVFVTKLLKGNEYC